MFPTATSSSPSKDEPQPLTPHWRQPSHPFLLRVRTSPLAFGTASYSQVSLPAGSFFCPLTFPPLTPAAEPTYATVQSGSGTHINLNSDLVFINHSCKPSLEFDMTRMEIRVARERDLENGGELTFFYPSTEWSMAKGFWCQCGEDGCIGWVDGAKSLGGDFLREGGWWMNGYIRDLLEQEGGGKPSGEAKGEVNGYANGVNGDTAHNAYTNGTRTSPSSRELAGEMGGDTTPSKNGVRAGATSRELGGEMSGDTSVANGVVANGDSSTAVKEEEKATGNSNLLRIKENASAGHSATNEVNGKATNSRN